MNASPRLRVPASLIRQWPHLPAFWPCEVLGPVAGDGDRLLLPCHIPVPAAWGGGVFRVTAGPFAPPSLAGRTLPAILFGAEAADPVAEALATPAIDAQRAAGLRALLRQARIGSPPGLPDPGPAALGVAAGEAVIVLDPCDPDATVTARALWAAALAAADRRPVIACRAPEAPAAARPVLADTRPGRFDPWTLIDAAAVLHAMPGPTALLATLAGVSVVTPGGPAPDGLAALSSLAAAARCADPVRVRPIAIEEAIPLLGSWRAQEVANRRIAVCLGMSFWKRRRMGAALSSAAGPPAFARTTRAAIAEASRRDGAIAVWSSRAPPGLEAAARAAGVPLLWVEDGFIRSAGLGAGFLPAASLTLDSRRPYYDPAGPSDLEILLATTEFPPLLLDRAAALRAALVARGVTKYNLGGVAPILPATPGRRRILVPGQVEDDLSVLRGGAGAVRSNLGLLQAVRAAHPAAFIAFKPHPDVEAGYRRGRVPPDQAMALADQVLDHAPMAPLLTQVDEVHTLTSLTGFEALLRGVPVTCWGQPFYAGWGLTEDHAPVARRVRRLTLDQLVAGALLVYPRYQDPVSAWPTTPESLLDRLSDPAPWRGGMLARLRRWQGAGMARLMRGRG
ncbi:capsular biosynthesis protein [Roseomonas sp. CAU 1739]|uniref:capsular polysaccharide export protein, LipB/KpsS family n=1 Tax=Roseomonas sp. CAU 1739 TaxID=3140364 RepID=UPI00325C0B38